MNTPLYCPLPITDKRRAWVSSDHTDVAETFRQFETIHVSPVYGDDYDRVQREDWLEIGNFK